MSQRKMTPKGQMSRSTNSGPAVMMMPPHIRATFMPNPPLKHIAPVKKRRKNAITGVAQFMVQMERTPPPPRRDSKTPRDLKKQRLKERQEQHKENRKPIVEEYRKHQKESGGMMNGMNCYNTLFVGRLAYEVTERKLLRELEVFGPIKDLKLIKDSESGKSRGYAFVEYEHEEDMKRAFRAADGMRMEGREIVVDVERGHTVPNWLPRRLGGGLGGTRLGGKDKNVTISGRFDPSRPEASRPPPEAMGRMGRGAGVPPPPPYGGGGGGGGGYGRGYGGRPYGGDRGPSYGGGGGGPYGGRGGGGDRYGGPPPRGPPRDWDRPGPPPSYGGDRKRGRSRSPPHDRSYRRRY